MLEEPIVMPIIMIFLYGYKELQICQSKSNYFYELPLIINLLQ